MDTGNTETAIPSSDILVLKVVNEHIVDVDLRAVYGSISDHGEVSLVDTASQETFPPVHERDTVVTEAPLSNNLIGTNGDGQVMYGGHLLYYYNNDAPPATFGQGKDNNWFLLDESGGFLQEVSGATEKTNL